MLKKIYIDNYKIFVNFSLELAPVNLLLGENGSGKTTLLEVIRKLKTFVIDRKEVTEIFKSSSVTRWQTVNLQRFEMTFEEDGVYVYHCYIEHDKSRQRCRLHSERLDYNQQPLFKFYLEETAGQIQSHAKLYNDQHGEGPELPFDWSQSGVGYIQARPDNQKLTRFKEILSRCLVVQIVPVNLTAVSDKEDAQLNYTVSNYVNWYRYVVQDVEKILTLSQTLRQVIPGFDNFKLDNSGDAKILQLRFKIGSTSYSCRFDELSDGQRTLIVLYTLIYGGSDYTLCVDEPENFLALREINPWLNACYDDFMGQLLVISHHPTIINNFSAQKVYWLSRPDHLQVRVQEVTKDQDTTGISYAELVERGWLL